MCGIVGYIGPRSPETFLLEGLARLEHRGYDSAGYALLQDGVLRVNKQVGRVRDLPVMEDLSQGNDGQCSLGLGHTRWATHGPANDANAHPHVSEDQKVAVVHNGIIDNADSLRSRLMEEGVTLRLTRTPRFWPILLRGRMPPRSRRKSTRRWDASKARMASRCFMRSSQTASS